MQNDASASCPTPVSGEEAETNFAKVPLDLGPVILAPERIVIHRPAIGTEFIGIRLSIGALAPLISPAPHSFGHPQTARFSKPQSFEVMTVFRRSLSGARDPKLKSKRNSPCQVGEERTARRGGDLVT